MLTATISTFRSRYRIRSSPTGYLLRFLTTPSSPSDPPFTAVVRYDNNVATIPFVGAEAEAKKLHDRMTKETHKHHVYLVTTHKATVPSGPYKSLDEAKAMLHGKLNT